MNDSSAENQYDLVRYPSYAHAQTHPDRLCVVATLMGLSPASVNNCRVLELGCGDASNLVPMACGLPASQFLGVELAEQPVKDAQKMIDDLGLGNIRVLQSDIMAADESWGQFDYIIAHGVYSWVPEPVREHVLEVCRRALAPEGIAYVSYNALPGGRIRQMLREMLFFHIRGIESPPERIAQARALAEFLCEGRNSQDLYSYWLRAESENILDHASGHFYHDELSPVNDAYYFTQFMERAAAHQLQYVGEADYFEMFGHGSSPKAREILAALGPSRILREQYLDFLKCRRFRQTLLCHARRQVRLDADAEKISALFLSSKAQSRDAADLRDGVKMTFKVPKLASCETDFPMGKAALVALIEKAPAPLGFDRCYDSAAELLNQAGLSHEAANCSRQNLRDFLAQLCRSGLVELRSAAPVACESVSQRPIASALARWQAQRGLKLTTAYHTSVQVEDEVGRNLVTWLDGTLDHAQLLDKLLSWAKSAGAVQASDPAAPFVPEKLAADLEENLAKLRRLGLLVG